MTRIGYSEDEDYPGQFNLWQANCARSLNGRKGQAALRQIEAALLALPTKRLIADDLEREGDVCAIGAVVRQRGLPAEHYDPECMEDVGVELGFPRLVAWKVVEVNDHELDFRYVRAPGPNDYYYPTYQPGYPLRVEYTPEERYDAMLKWVRAELASSSRPASSPEGR